jgi:hypothetical protein
MAMRLQILWALMAALGVSAGWAQQAGTEVTAEAVRQALAEGKSLAGASFGPLDLAGVRAGAVDLSGTRWRGTDWRGAVFEGTHLTGAQLEDVIARGATFIGADLSGLTALRTDLAGARLQDCLIAGVQLQECNLAGADFSGCRYSLSGARYLDALARALTAATGQTVNPAVVGGLTGDAFAFVYSPANPTAVPTTPFTEHPFKTLATATGLTLQVFYDLGTARATETLKRSLAAGSQCLLLVSVAGSGLQGSDLQEPFWAVAKKVLKQYESEGVVLDVPPFGERYIPFTDLPKSWEGPYATLEPIGTGRVKARYTLCVLVKPTGLVGVGDALRAGVKRAAEIILDRRTYGAWSPGAMGLKKLAGDLQAAETLSEAQRAALAQWFGTPRKVLIGARRQAAEFLDAAAETFPDAQKAPLVQAAALFRAEAAFLETKVPDLSRAVGNWADAARAIQEAAGIETTAAGLLEEAVGTRAEP